MTGQPEGQGKGIQQKGGFGIANKDMLVLRMISSLMTGQPEGQGKGIQRKGGFGIDNKDLLVLRMMKNAREVIQWVVATLEG